MSIEDTTRVFRNEPMPDHESFCEPQTLEEAEAAFAAALYRAQSIQADLGCDRRYLPDGTEMPRRDFEQWRRRAKLALLNATEHQRLLKQRISEFRSRKHASSTKNADRELLSRCGAFLERLDGEGVLNDEGKDLLAAIRREGFTKGFSGGGAR